ncbi:MAG: PqqD family protein [Deltaproteobacteria bacterium]|nr:PqqD family protein [Deltaproteobacteria bacterium]
MTGPGDTLPQHRTLHRAPGAAWRFIDAQVAIISADVNRIRLLNQVGSFVWERCEGATVPALVDAVCAAYTVDRLEAERDVGAFVEDLLRRGLVTASGGPP